MELQLPGQRRLSLEQPVIMGILNATPDSFSDAGMWLDVDVAVEHGLTMVAQGAQLIDVGGESTRPGAQPVSVKEQIRRITPVIGQLAKELAAQGGGAVISIDTTSSEVARAAIDAGAVVINDVSAGRFDAGMLRLAARSGAAIVLMHMQGTPRTMQENPTYVDVTAEVVAFLVERIEAALAAGVARERIVIDPGIGFGKTREHNLQLLADLKSFAAMGYPVLLGASRKRFMGSLLTQSAGPTGVPPLARELVGATCATTALGVAAGVRMFRVHDVQANMQAALVAWHLLRQGWTL